MALLKILSSVQWQNSRINWLKEGDIKTNFFYGVIFSRRRSNVIISLDVSGSQVEGVEVMRSVVFQHFRNHFKMVADARLGLEEL